MLNGEWRDRREAAIVRLLFALSVPVLRSRSRRNETNQALNLAPFANMAAHPLADRLAASLSDPSALSSIHARV